MLCNSCYFDKFAVQFQYDCTKCVKAVLPKDFYSCDKCGFKQTLDYYIEVCEEHLNYTKCESSEGEGKLILKSYNPPDMFEWLTKSTFLKLVLFLIISIIFSLKS